MVHWSDIVQNELLRSGGKKDEGTEWNIPYNETGYAAEIREYWERVGRNESMENVCKDIGGRGWD